MISRADYGQALHEGLGRSRTTIGGLVYALIEILDGPTWKAYQDETFEKLTEREKGWRKSDPNTPITAGIYAIWMKDASMARGGVAPEYTKSVAGEVLILALSLFEGQDWYDFTRNLEEGRWSA